MRQLGAPVVGDYSRSARSRRAWRCRRPAAQIAGAYISGVCGDDSVRARKPPKSHTATAGTAPAVPSGMKPFPPIDAVKADAEHADYLRRKSGREALVLLLEFIMAACTIAARWGKGACCSKCSRRIPDVDAEAGTCLPCGVWS
jgi:hypothetical protein